MEKRCRAAVVLAESGSEDAIRAFCGEHMADFKVPDRVYLVDSFPRTATGKIQRRHVASEFAETE